MIHLVIGNYTQVLSQEVLVLESARKTDQKLAGEPTSKTTYLANVTLPSFNSTVLDNPDLLSHLIDEPVVVRHQDDTAIKLVDGLGQSIDRFQVQVIRLDDIDVSKLTNVKQSSSTHRFIEQQHVGRGQSQPSENYSAPLTIADLLHRNDLAPSSKTEPAKDVAHFLILVDCGSFLVPERVDKESNGGLGQIQLVRQMLVEARDSKVMMSLDFASRCGNLKT
jgi:hypothetical protein